jgi:hypothetical protein
MAARLASVVALLLLAGPYAAARAEFSVHAVEARLAAEQIEFDAQLGLSLTPRIEEALGKGIPIDVVMQLALVRTRSLLWDYRVAGWELRWRIQYHALSGQYLVSGLHPDFHEVESFDDLAAALAWLAARRGVILPLPAGTNIEPAAQYELQLRVHLDIEALPSPLRPMAYTSPSWHLNSGATQWPIQR